MIAQVEADLFCCASGRGKTLAPRHFIVFLQKKEVKQHYTKSSKTVFHIIKSKAKKQIFSTFFKNKNKHIKSRKKRKSKLQKSKRKKSTNPNFKFKKIQNKK